MQLTETNQYNAQNSNSAANFSAGKSKNEQVYENRFNNFAENIVN